MRRTYWGDTNRVEQRQRQAIRRLVTFYRKQGRSPTARELGAGAYRYRDRSLPHYQTLRDLFGSLREALEAAGLPTRAVGVRLMRPKGEWREADRPRPKYMTGDDFWAVFREAQQELQRL